MSLSLSLFHECVEVILDNEGGFQNNPNDPGNWVGGFRTGILVGTKYGIAAKFFPDVDIKNLTRHDAADLYYEYYWKRMNLEGINNPEIVLQIFDMGVNAGKANAIRKAQRLAEVKPDGIMGDVTKKAINNYCGDFLFAYKHARKVYYEWLAENKPWAKKFLKGWLNRVEETRLFYE